jgi:hypothetical protein
MKVKSLLQAIKSFLFLIGGLILGVIAYKKISEIGKPVFRETWKPLPGHKDKVTIKDYGKTEVIQLPKDAKGNQIKNDEILAVGHGKGGVKVEILHDH